MWLRDQTQGLDECERGGGTTPLSLPLIKVFSAHYTQRNTHTDTLRSSGKSLTAGRGSHWDVLFFFLAAQPLFYFFWCCLCFVFSRAHRPVMRSISCAAIKPAWVFISVTRPGDQSHHSQHHFHHQNRTTLPSAQSPPAPFSLLLFLLLKSGRKRRPESCFR